MNIEKKLTEFIERNLSSEQFLVELKLSAGNRKVSVFVDSAQGVSIDECAECSRKLGDYIEAEELIPNAYNLEVSSPGLDQPLIRIEQYQRNVGRDLKITLADGKEYSGRVEQIENNTIVLTPINTRTKKKSKEYEKETMAIPFDEILKAYIIISFN